MADLEGGLYLEGSRREHGVPSLTYTYVTAMEKNDGNGDVRAEGRRRDDRHLEHVLQRRGSPAGYSPMKKQGSIVLGSGGDCCYSNNNASSGTFYEGAIVAGYPSDATDTAIQANIVSAGYGK